MTANRRIFLNIVATYGRSLYALVIGLFCGRWTYLSLGKIDYGLLGVVGGLIGFVTFFNTLMAGSVSRFYAFSVGEAQKEGNERDGLEKCRRWFSIAVLIHTVLPIALMAVGYPIGEWAVRHYLTIPADRIEACVWVWRFTSLSCFFGMVGVPFAAMYNAKQEIAELTIYGLVTTTLNVFFGYYMITHPGVWIVKYAAWSCVIAILPQMIICVRAVIAYPECRFHLAYALDWSSMRALVGYVGGRFVVALSLLLTQNGIGVLVNRCLGPVRNSAMAISSTISRYCLSLSSSFSGAFSPAITNAAGSCNLIQMRKLAYGTCRFSAIAVGIFAIPMILEIDAVLKLWLKDPPAWAGSLCVCSLICAMMDKLSEGCWITVFAVGKVAAFNACEAAIWFLALPLAYVLIERGFDVVGVGFASIILNVLAVCVKVYFGKRVGGLSVWHWFSQVLTPVILTFSCALFCGGIITHCFNPCFSRIIVTGVVVELVLFSLSWIFVLRTDERLFCLSKIRKMLLERK